MKACSILLAAILLACAANHASADFTNVAFSGPGGTGTDGLTGGNLTEPRLTYTSINFIDVTLTVNASGSYLVNEAPGFGFVHNTTGQTWVGFDLTILPGTTATFTSDWFDASNELTTVAQSPTDILFTGGTVPDTSFFEPNGHFNATAAGTIVIRETPIVVPEASSKVFLSMGILALLLLRRLIRRGRT